MAVLSSVIGRGTLAARPAAGSAGRLYFATDGSGTMYRDNGSSWDSVETSVSGLADQGTATYLDFAEAAAPGTPASGKVRLYAKADGSLYQKDDAGTETVLAGGGEGGLYPLDDVTLHGTYGDHFLGPALASRWTNIRAISAKMIRFDNSSWGRIVGIPGFDDWGILQSWTPTAEAWFDMAATAFTGAIAEKGLGIAVLDSSGTGIWLGFREASRMGIHTVTTYAIGDEPAYNPMGGMTIVGNQLLGLGRKCWWRLVKHDTVYTFAYSFDGATWTQDFAPYTPSAFTPAYIGIMGGVTGWATNYAAAVDWFNVRGASYGNNLMITPTSGTVTASAAATTGGAPSDVIDGSTGDEWYVAGTNNPIWWQAAFSVAQTINRLRLRTRGDAWGAGYVEFSDGSEVPFYMGGNDTRYLDFPDKTTTFVKVHCLRLGHGANPGFTEIEAYRAT